MSNSFRHNEDDHQAPPRTRKIIRRANRVEAPAPFVRKPPTLEQVNADRARRQEDPIDEPTYAELFGDGP